METIGRTLKGLAGADRGIVEDLRLPPNIYPDECLEAASEAFRGFCSVRVVGGDDRSLAIIVHPQHREMSARVVGEFLNHLLALSLRHHPEAP